MMSRVILRLFLWVLCAAPLNAEAPNPVLVKQIETYLDGLKTYQADLQQVNPDQSVAKGKFFLNRPHKFRVQYSEPKEQIVVSDGKFFIEYDPKEDVPNFISLESTPASLFLRDKLRLSGDVSVKSLHIDSGVIYAVLYKTQEPDVGSLTMVFREKPMQLIGWMVEDGQGNITKVSLRNVIENKPIKDSLFETSRISR